MKFEISADEVQRAKHPHELFLINLIFNHVLLFIATVSAASLQVLVSIVPIISVGIVTYTLWRAKRALVTDPPFVRCHWQVAAKRSRAFIALWGILAVIALAVLWVAGGDLKPQHYAVAGVVGLPTMLTLLVLILLESEAMQQARNGALPEWAARDCPMREEALAES